METGDRLNRLFSSVPGFQEFFAVKALPNLAILKLMRQLGFGFDCSSVPELALARFVEASPKDIMFTSNNTSTAEFLTAVRDGGCVLNLDDITFIDKVNRLGVLPELVCFRYNPGERRTGNAIIGKPTEAKYGVRHDQVVEAYRRAQMYGAKRFGIHTMICSNELNYQYMVETVRMLLGVIEEISQTLGITFEFMNIGGGMGIPYRLEQQPFDFVGLAKETVELLVEFNRLHGYTPRFFMESGRAITGPHGVLVTSVINRMSKYREYVGVDACMSSLMRPAMYDAYHHITVYDKDGLPRNGEQVLVDVVGALCENNDKLAKQRLLPPTVETDLLVIHDTGAHGIAMGFNYNGRLRPKELLLRANGDVEMIRRAETVGDYFRPMCEFTPGVLVCR